MVLRTIAMAAEEHLQVALLGACSGHPDPGMWHREDETEPDYSPDDTRSAVAICRTCPVRQWCEGTFDAEEHGVFAGRTPAQRVDRRDNLSRAEAKNEWRRRKRQLARESATCS